MPLPIVWDLLAEHLFDVPSTDTLFNPYHTQHPTLDRPGAPATRRANLRAYLDAYDHTPPLFLLAEAPGPWGCRFSGVPLTAEAQLVDPAFPIDGAPTSREAPHTEYSAGIFWRVVQPVFPHFFVWNSVPFHPHDADAPLTIRTPRRREVRRWSGLLEALLNALQPTCIVGIGRKGERALTEIGADVTYVRHPSQGGAKKFEAGIRSIVDALGHDQGIL
jgi:hypothetical protein